MKQNIQTEKKKKKKREKIKQKMDWIANLSELILQ